MALLLVLSPWLHAQTVQQALTPAPREALSARCVQLVSILLLLLLRLAAAAVQLVPMALALAFLPQAIALPVVLACTPLLPQLPQQLPA